MAHSHYDNGPFANDKTSSPASAVIEDNAPFMRPGQCSSQGWSTIQPLQKMQSMMLKAKIFNHQRFKQNAAELEAALAPVRKAAAGEGLTTDALNPSTLW